MKVQKNVQNPILEKLFEDDEIKEAIDEHTAYAVANALDNFKKNSKAKYGKPGEKKNIPVQPDCFGKYIWDETPHECRSCRFAQKCKVKSKVKLSKKTDKK